MSTLLDNWHIWLPALLLLASHALVYYHGNKRGRGIAADLKFVDAVLDQLRGGTEVEMGEMLDALDEQGYDREVADRTLQAMEAATIITIKREQHHYTFKGVPVRSSMTVMQATS